MTDARMGVHGRCYAIFDIFNLALAISLQDITIYFLAEQETTPSLELTSQAVSINEETGH